MEEETLTTGLNSLAKQIYSINKANGWNNPNQSVAEQLMLIVTEVSEACEADRKDRFASNDALNLVKTDLNFGHKNLAKLHFAESIKDTFQDELADVIIRCLDMCARHNIDIESHVALKLMFNKTRGFHHGGKEILKDYGRRKEICDGSNSGREEGRMERAGHSPARRRRRS